MLYRRLIRPVLYMLDPERAHHLTIGVLRWLSKAVFVLRPIGRGTGHPSLRVEAFGRKFANPIGLAAGLDKNAEAYGALFALGFGSVEVGTLTGQAQPGNPTPRLFRLVSDRALVNRMGFNNVGAQDAAARIKATGKRGALLGINIGKTKVVAANDTAEDYAVSTRALAPLADYLVVNVSSPNTPGLRDLQAVAELRPLLIHVRAVADEVTDTPVPLLVKIAPDLSNEDVDAVAELALELGLDGIIATNTTVSRTGLRTAESEVSACGAGGLSGPVLNDRSLEVLRRLRAKVGDRLVLVSVGGIENADQVYERMAAGATLVQIYTGLIYHGPGLPARLCRGLARRLKVDGLSNVQELIGRDS